MLGQKLSQQWYSAPYGVQSTAPDLHRFPSRSWPVSCKGRSYAMGHLSSSSRLIASLRLTVEQILSSALVLINAALNRSIRTDHLTTYYFHTEYEVHVLPDLSNEWPILYLVTTRKHTYSLSLSPACTCIRTGTYGVHTEYGVFYIYPKLITSTHGCVLRISTTQYQGSPSPDKPRIPAIPEAVILMNDLTRSCKHSGELIQDNSGQCVRQARNVPLSYSSPDVDSDHGGFWGSILDLIPGCRSIHILSLIYVPVLYIQ